MPEDAQDQNKNAEKHQEPLASKGESSLESTDDIIRHLAEQEQDISKESAFKKGSKIGIYIVVKPLNHSGFGELYLAANTLTKKLFALKLLPLLLPAIDENFETRFNEASERLRKEHVHPGIIYIHDMGNDGSYYYIVMDYVETFKGKTYSLYDRLERKVRISEEKIKKMALQICSALKYAHSRKDWPIIHSDLKPSNVLLDKSQKIILTDFITLEIIGYDYFIKIVRDAIHNTVALPNLQDSADMINKDAPLERTKRAMLLSTAHDYMSTIKNVGRQCVKRLLGKKSTFSSYEIIENPKRQMYTKNSKSVVESYDYMSPEQKAGEQATEKSNVYSMGLMLYKMLTGVKVSGTWDLPSRYGCNRSWDAIIFKCLQLEPEHRFQSISELEQAILKVNEKKSLMMTAIVISVLLLITAVGLVFTISLIDFDKDMRFFKLKDKIISFFEFVEKDKKLSTIPIEFAVKPKDAQIKIMKDEELCKTATSQASTFTIDLEPGEYDIEITRTGYITFKGKAQFNEEKTAFEKRLRLENPLKTKKYVYLENLKKPKFNHPWSLPDLEITLLPIDPGTFMLGSSKTDPERHEDEILQTTVHVRLPFWMSEKEITQKQYDEIMWHNPSLYRGEADLPVEKVSWRKAMEFCKKLTQKEKEAGRLPDDYIYRLPTEIEWEYCCRAESNQPYFFGDDKTLLEDFTWYDANSERRPHEVGGKHANAWNLYDMLGNVWEWTLDSYGKEIPALIIANGEKSQNAEYILRGGSWRNFPEMLRCATRMKVDSPTFTDSSIGFRIVLAPQTPPAK